MRKEKMNRKNRRAKKLVVCTLLLALLTVGVDVQNAPLVYAEEDMEEDVSYEFEESYKWSFTDDQGIQYGSYDGESFIVSSGEAVTKSAITIPASVVYNGKDYPVTEVNADTFNGNKKIKTVTIKNGISVIWGAAFANCVNLKKITLPNSVQFIDQSLFSGCKKLETVNLGSKTEGIGFYAFYGCKSLKSIKIPNGLASIEPSAFYGCGLKSITLPNSVTYIGVSAFAKNSSLLKW